ncbi:MAG TPA: extracellular solute-binding protein [Gaiellaceae bacterium]|nr:extracellular solute-binding protein [Gaiellaceae bacterium]
MRLRRLTILLVVGVVVAITATAAAARINSARGTTTITFWDAYSTGGPEVQHLEKVVIPAFEKSHPGIVVKDVTIPYDSLHQKLVTAVAGGQLPDLVRSDIIWVPELANLGVLAPLDKVMPSFKTMSKAVFPGPLATNYWKGHYYGLPLDTNTRIWLYNPAALQAIGASAPPANFSQLQSMSAQAKAKGYDLYAESGTSCWNLCPWIWSNGGSITNKTYTQATGFLNGPKAVAAIQMLVNLYKAGEMPGIIVDSNAGLGTYDGINQNKYVGMLDGPWALSIFASAYKKTQLAASLVPAGPGGSVSVVGGEDIVMTKASKHQQAAEEFMQYMLGTYAQTQMARAGQMPVIKTSSKWLTKIHPYYATYLKQIATAKPRTPTPKWTQIDQVITTDVAKAFTGSESVQQALTEAATQIDSLLK